MLTKNAIFVLGIIADNPINPYSICKLINYKRENFRSALPLQTVYSMIKSLHEKKLIFCKKTKKVSMPHKTIYSITPKGKELLKKSVLSYLSEPEEPFSELQISLTILGHLLSIGDMDKETALTALQEYRDKLKKEIRTGEKLYAEEAARNVAGHILLSMKNIHQRLKIDLATIDNFIQYFKNNTGWIYSPIPFWRDELTKKRKT